MSRFDLIGASYTSSSFNVDAERTVNWMVELIEGSGKSAKALYPFPGLKVFTTLADSPVRGEFIFNGRMFVVAGSTLFEVFTNGTSTSRGAVANDGNPAVMVCGPLHLLVASGGHAYVLVLATNVLTDLTAATTLPNISFVGYSDGFFVALKQNSNQWFASSPLDATTWPGTSTAQVSVFPDNVLALIVDHREALLLGSKQSQFYYDSGATPFPFDIIPGAFIDVGISDPYTLCRLDNSPFFIGQDERGYRMAWRIQGYNPIRVSNHAIETAWQAYPNDGKAFAYTFQYNGHLFWQVTFPTANGGNGATHVYDVTIGGWVDRDHFVGGISKAHQTNSHVMAFGMHLVGDPTSGNIYQTSAPVLSGSTWTFCDDAGNAIRRYRRSPTISIENQWVHHNFINIDAEVGLGPIPPLLDGSGNARDPQLMLRWSNDSGKTWSNINTLNCGQAGNYSVRAIQRRLGRARNRIYEISATDPIPWRIADAYLDADPGHKPQERLVKDLAKRA